MTSQITPTTAQKQARKLKEGLMQSLQQALEAGNPGKVTQFYYVRLPTEEAHHMCHPTKGAMGFSQRIHPELITKIHDLVQTGVTDPTVVQRFCAVVGVICDVML